MKVDPGSEAPPIIVFDSDEKFNNIKEILKYADRIKKEKLKYNGYYIGNVYTIIEGFFLSLAEYVKYQEEKIDLLESQIKRICESKNC
jgi:hypothetical protein